MEDRKRDPYALSKLVDAIKRATDTVTVTIG
jgi:hypothetical protein